MARRIRAAVVSLAVVGLVNLILFGLLLLFLGLDFNTVWPFAVFFGSAAAAIGFCCPKFAMLVLEWLD